MISIRQLIRKYFCNEEEPEPEFTILHHRSRQHLLRTLRRQFQNADIHIADSDYSAPDLQEFNTWLADDQIDTRAYHPEWYDCDDFARALRCKMFKIGQSYKTTLTVAYCQGYAQGTYHAYNLLIDNKDDIYIIEPQNDQCVPIEQSTYRTDFIQL